MKKIILFGLVLLSIIFISGCIQGGISEETVLDLARNYTIENNLNDSVIVNGTIDLHEFIVFENDTCNYYLYPEQIIIERVHPTVKYYSVFDDCRGGTNKKTQFHIHEEDIEQVENIISENYTNVHTEDFYIVSLTFDYIDPDLIVTCYNETGEQYCLGGVIPQGASIMVDKEGNVIGVWSLVDLMVL